MNRFLSSIVFRISPFSLYTISGNSMNPFLTHGEQVLVNNWAYLFFSPAIGDCVVVNERKKGIEIVKRIVSKSGNKRYMIEGDNKNESRDSRVFGSIRKQDIVGKVIKKVG